MLSAYTNLSPKERRDAFEDYAASMRLDGAQMQQFEGNYKIAQQYLSGRTNKTLMESGLLELKRADSQKPTQYI